MERKQNITFLAKGDFKQEVEIIKKLKVPFTISYSNFTAIIETEFFKKTYITEQRSNNVFIAKNMINKDMLEFSANEWPVDILNSGFFFNEELNEYNIDKIYNIDLSNAYASILLIDGFISEKTYKFLLRLPKIDRLICVGIFAACQKKFWYNSEGEQIDFDVIESETRGLFYWCVRRVNEIMLELKKIAGDKFLFFWVDGIYFTDNSINQLLFDYLDGLKLKYKYEVLKNFVCINPPENNYFKVSYEKGEIKKKIGDNIKRFSIAKKDTSFFKQIISVTNEKQFMRDCYKLIN